MESPLEVLSRAATMVQDTNDDSKITAKELPTTKWRRDRRSRNSPDYHHHAATAAISFQNCLRLGAANNQQLISINNNSSMEILPLDMTLTVKPRSPPPPYRAPLPGSIYASNLSSINKTSKSIHNSSSNYNSDSNSSNPRPSVITQAPKRNSKGGKSDKESISMCDPVIDEHFRRSLGDDYMVLFSQNNNKKQKTIDENGDSDDTCKSEPKLIDFDENSENEQNDNENMENMDDNSSYSNLSDSSLVNERNSKSSINLIHKSNDYSNNNSNNSCNNIKATTNNVKFNSIDDSVDDHFAKALGDTWKKLQEENTNIKLTSQNNNKKPSIRPCIDQVV